MRTAAARGSSAVPSREDDRRAGRDWPVLVAVDRGRMEETVSARFYTNGLLAGSFIVAGVVVNGVVVSCWLRDRGVWLPLYYYFLTFACWNLALLSSTFFFYSLPALLGQPADRSTIPCVPYFYLLGYAGANCSLTAVVWLMVVLTVERYVAVVKPFHTRLSSPRRRAKLISLVLTTAALLYNIPLLFELTIAPSSEGNSSQPRWMVQPAPFRANFYYQTLYRVSAHFLFISLSPLAVISVLTGKIVLVIHRTNSERARYRRANPAEEGSVRAHRVTYGNVTLTVVVLKFLLCYTLPCVLNVMEMLVEPDVFHTDELMWITDLSDFLVILDSVSNALLYFSWRRRSTFYRKHTDGASEYMSAVGGSLGRNWANRKMVKAVSERELN